MVVEIRKMSNVIYRLLIFSISTTFQWWLRYWKWAVYICITLLIFSISTTKVVEVLKMSLYHSWNLTQNNKILISGFFPDFPDPVFSQNFFLLRLAKGQTLCQFFAHFYYINYICCLVTWQKLAGMKNAKNILFLGKYLF